MDKKKMKKILSIITIVTLLSMTVLGAWILSLDGNITGNVISDEGGVVYWETIFTPIGEVNTTTQPVIIKKIANITNLDGNLTFMFTTNENITDVIDSCDNTGDLNISYNFNGVRVNSNDVVILESGNNYIEAIFNYKLQSCPASFNIDISLIEV